LKSCVKIQTSIDPPAKVLADLRNRVSAIATGEDLLFNAQVVVSKIVIFELLLSFIRQSLQLALAMRVREVPSSFSLTPVSLTRSSLAVLTRPIQPAHSLSFSPAN